MKYIIGLVAILLPLLSGAQSPPVKQLNIGDTVPDITITNVYNYPSSTIRLSDLKGKLVILDFWSTWCGACIDAFPKMHQLQKEFGDQLQVIMVNTYSGDTIQRVKPFFEKRKERTGQEVTLPYSLLQSSLKDYFPYKFIPHYVWIDQQGKISAITFAAEVTPSNIAAMIRGNARLHQKNDILSFDYNKPLFVDGNGGNGGKFLFRSILTGYMEGLGSRSGIVKNDDGKVTMWYVFNSTALGLIKVAFSDNPNISADRIILETSDRSKFSEHAGRDSDWYTGSFCYQLSVPPSTISEILSFMKEDVLRAFHIRISNEKKKIKSLRLLPVKHEKKLKTKGRSDSILTQKGNNLPRFNNVPIKELASWLEKKLHMPVINDTGIKSSVNINLPTSLDFTNRATVIQALLQAGLEVIETETEHEYAVVRDLL